MATSVPDLFKDLNLSIRIIPESDVDISRNIIGKGGFGIVYKGTWCNTVVAVKRIRLSLKQEKYVKRELFVMDQIRHPNFVSIMAAAISYNNCYIVMEYFPSCNLRDLLFDNVQKANMPLKEKDKIIIAHQITTAIAYLHDISHPEFTIIHEDIKPENILVNCILHVKLCDLGLSRSNRMPKGLETSQITFARGTPLYCAPELLNLLKPATTASDVWAVACVLIELFTNIQVWEKIYTEEIISLFEDKKKPTPLKTLKCLELKLVLEKCFDYDPLKRPGITVLHKLFDMQLNPHKYDIFTSSEEDD